MSVILYYVRTDAAGIEMFKRTPEAILDDDLRSDGTEIIDIDKAYDPLAWLASPLKRAEAAHNARVMSDKHWPDADALASIKALNNQPVDDVLAAIEGRSVERLDAAGVSAGGAAFFSPELVRCLSDALAAVTEPMLRDQLDVDLMERDCVVPGYWIEESEDIFCVDVVPALRRLQVF